MRTIRFVLFFLAVASICSAAGFRSDNVDSTARASVPGVGSWPLSVLSGSVNGASVTGNITGNAANVTGTIGVASQTHVAGSYGIPGAGSFTFALLGAGTVPIASGGTGAVTSSAALLALGGSSLTATTQTFTGQVHLASVPYFIAYHSVAAASASTLNNTNVTATFATVLYDTYGKFSTGNTYTIPVTGLYYIRAQVAWASNALGSRQVFVLVNGANSAPLIGTFALGTSSAVYQTVSASGIIYLTAGQAITVLIWQNSTGQLSYADGSTDSTFFEVAAIALP